MDLLAGDFGFRRAIKHASRAASGGPYFSEERVATRNDLGNIFAPMKGRYTSLAKVFRHETISGVRSDPTFLFWDPEAFRPHLRRSGRRRDSCGRRLRGMAALLVKAGRRPAHRIARYRAMRSGACLGERRSPPRRAPGKLSAWDQSSRELEGDGAEIFVHACRLGAEGIVSKHRERPYPSGRRKLGSRPRTRLSLAYCGSERCHELRPTISQR